MSKYVVTGGAGFIGSAIVRALLREGAGKVTVIDNLLSGREENLDEVRQSVDFHRADIRHYERNRAGHPRRRRGFPRGRHPFGAALDRRSGAFARSEYRRHVSSAARRSRRPGAPRGVCRLIVGLRRHAGPAESGNDAAACRNRPMRCRNWWANITAASSRRASAWIQWRCATSMSMVRARTRRVLIPACSRSL